MTLPHEIVEGEKSRYFDISDKIIKIWLDCIFISAVFERFRDSMRNGRSVYCASLFL